MKEIPPKMVHDKLGLYKGQWLPEMDREPEEKADYPDREEAAITLCSFIAGAAEEAMMKLRKGIYNEEVERDLPYPFRTGVIKRSVV